ncbi:MAG: hypothetical protein O9274_10335 [Limnobacter sp.]|uniref:hypothetical protein n=1 Tax=Limnobacter sp. TaxID=2003368 RepID=UPI0022BBA563|nr:hypothetical protein [Limnobacter sp.]MCZ8016084.1 hypothetical protein [Limnobacter sp.]
MNSILAQSRAVFIALFAMWALVACSPQFNWRTVPNADLGYMATFPDKPAQVTRTMDLIGLQVPLTLQAAQVQGMYFAVGTVPLQGNLEGQGIALRDALALAVANNIAAEKPELVSIQWLGKPVQEMSLSGKLPDGSVAFAHARFFEHQGTLYEVLLMGPGQRPAPEVLTSWLGGFSLLGM